MPPAIAARYRARDGTEHRVLIRRHPTGGWRVLDVGETTFIVETLTGSDDRLAQAEALARDYASRAAGLPPGPARGPAAARAARQPLDEEPHARPERISRRDRARSGRHPGRAPNLATGAPCGSCRPQPGLPPPLIPGGPHPAGAGGEPLPCRVRLADGRVFTGALPADAPPRAPARDAARRHRRARRAHARHARRRRRARARPAPPRPSTSCPAAPAATPDWLAALLAHAERIVAGAYARARSAAGPREEVFVGVAPRAPAARRQARRRRTPAVCGSTSTGPSGSTRCGRCWPSGRATC